MYSQQQTESSSNGDRVQEMINANLKISYHSQMVVADKKRNRPINTTKSYEPKKQEWMVCYFFINYDYF